MDGREDQVAGIGSAKGGRERERISNFADQKRVRILTHGGLERVLKAFRILADFNLADEAFPVFVLILDRVFDRDDALGTRAVDLAYDCGERRRFTRTRGARDDDDAAVELGQVFHNLRQVQIGEVRDLGHDAAQHAGVLRAAVEHVDAETRFIVRKGVGTVDRALLFQRL